MAEESWEDIPLFSMSASDIPKLVEGETVPDNVSDSMAILSHILHDEDTPEERSDLMRDRGNRNLKLGSRGAIKRAVNEYSAALAVEGLDSKTRSLGHLNRAAAEIKLGNYGRALNDSKSTVKLDPTNGKAYWRGSYAANRVGRWDEALDLGMTGLQMMAAGSVSKNLLEREVQKAKEGQQKEREKGETLERKAQAQTAQQEALTNALASRNIQVGPPLFAQQRKYAHNEPQLAEDGSIFFPVLFVYPQLSDDFPPQSDYIEAVHEDDTISMHFDDMLPPPWDFAGNFNPGQVEALYRSKWTLSPSELKEMIRTGQALEKDYVGSERGPDDVGDWHTVPLHQPLSKILSKSDYIVPQFPVFYIVPKGYRPP